MSATEMWVIAGRVQGVGFREWMVEAARRENVRGHVRNRADGTVEALVSSAGSERLDRLAASVAIGPGAAEVRSVERRPISVPASALPARFERR